MLGYVVKSKDTPMGIARALTGDAGRVVELVAANPHLRKKIIGRDMQSGKVITTFLDADFHQGVVLRLPGNWKVRTGMVGASGEGDGEGGGAQVSLAESICKMQGKIWDASSQTCIEGGSNCANATLADICNPASDCWDEALCKSKGGSMQSNNCNSSNMIKTVQQALIDSGQSLPKYGVDGSWGCESQNALNKSGKSFKELAGQECQGPVPSATGCGGGNVIPPTPKKKEGEACTDSSECEAGLTCIGGKCSKDVTPKKAGGSSALWWILGGLAGAAAVVGVAVAGGAFDGDKKKGPAAR